MPQARGLPQGAAPDEARGEVRRCRCSPSSTRPAPIPASTPRSAASPRPSAATCSRWRACSTPIIVTVIGEGGSGGALAIAVGDVVLMLQYATYSVISPEGCASILWKSADKAPEAAEALGITASRLKTLGLIDKIVPEPLGGAHRDPQADRRPAEEGARRSAQAAAGEEAQGAGRGAPRAPDGLWQVQGSRPNASGRPRAMRGKRVAVGLSGGVDSVVLLHQLHGLAPRSATSRAIHVHHGLSPNADAWTASAAALQATGTFPSRRIG